MNIRRLLIGCEYYSSLQLPFTRQVTSEGDREIVEFKKLLSTIFKKKAFSTTSTLV